MFLRILFGLFLLAVSLAYDIPSTSTCLLNTFPQTFSLVPINLHPDSDIVGPTCLNAISFITLGIPSTSEHGDVSVGSFTLDNGWLFENSGLSVHFSAVDGFKENKFGVTESSVLKAGGCDGECGQFCVDKDGYLVSVAPLVTNDGSFVGDRVKFYACPNDEQNVFGGGEYKVFSNRVPNPRDCVPIYLGLKGLNGDADKGHDQTPCLPPFNGIPGQVCGMPSLVTQIWDGQVQAPTPGPPSPPPPAPAPPPTPAPVPAPVPFPHPASPARVPPPRLPPLVSEISDGQIQSPIEPTTEPEPIAFPLTHVESQTPTLRPSPAPAPTLSVVPPPVSSSPIPTFQGSAGRIVGSSAAGWIIFAFAMHLAI